MEAWKTKCCECGAESANNINLCNGCLGSEKAVALREQREGIAGMVTSMLTGGTIIEEVYKAILAYGQGKEGEEDG
jgi:hypothetical protein